MTLKYVLLARPDLSQFEIRKIQSRSENFVLFSRDTDF